MSPGAFGLVAGLALVVSFFMFEDEAEASEKAPYYPARGGIPQKVSLEDEMNFLQDIVETAVAKKSSKALFEAAYALESYPWENPEAAKFAKETAADLRATAKKLEGKSKFEQEMEWAGEDDWTQGDYGYAPRTPDGWNP